MAGGKCPPTPIGPTNPGPRRIGVVTLGFESTSRRVSVDWLILRIVRDVSGALSLAKNAAVRAFATAPSMA